MPQKAVAVIESVFSFSNPSFFFFFYGANEWGKRNSDWVGKREEEKSATVFLKQSQKGFGGEVPYFLISILFYISLVDGFLSGHLED